MIKSAANDMIVRTRTPVALYILNQKRAHLRDLERRFGVAITVEADDTLSGSNYHAFERGEPASGVREELETRHAGYGAPPADAEDFMIEEESEAEAENGEAEAEDEIEAGDSREAEGGAAAEGEQGRRRRRRRRRRGERPAGENIAADAPQPTDDGLAAIAEIGGDFAGAEPVPRAESEGGSEDEESRPASRRRRSRRGRRDRDRFAPAASETGAMTEEASEVSLGSDETAPTGDAPQPTEAAGNVEPSEVIAEAPAAHETASAPAEHTANAPTSEAVEASSHAAAPESEAAPVEASEAPATHEPAPAEPAPAAAPAPEEPPRPRRTGWWQRARATLVGEE
ncbi:MAG: hypothetical protein JO234_02375 [Hyphomicrobiales bacterium]|nr:hypothetical protein [Hyphomicrobiales bacterium]